jgi:hypothetical protein
MATRRRTPAHAGVHAANLLVDACQTDPDNSLRLEVVSSLALDLGRRLETLARDNSLGSLIEGALACADLATLAACNLQALPDNNRPLAASAVHLAAGTTRALITLVELEAAALDEPGAENTLRDARSARWRADLAVQQVEE